MLAALSRFGQFSGLQLMTSAPNDVYPSTPTFTFVHATYTSGYLAFASVELETNQAVNGHYQKLQSMTPAQAQIFQQFDAPPYVAQSAVGTIPFLDVANHYLLNGSPFSPQVLHGETWQQIAQAVQQPANAEAQAILGGANVLDRHDLRRGPQSTRRRLYVPRRPAGSSGRSMIGTVDAAP